MGPRVPGPWSPGPLFIPIRTGDTNWITLPAKRGANKQTSWPAGIDNRLYFIRTSLCGQSYLNSYSMGMLIAPDPFYQ